MSTLQAWRPSFLQPPDYSRPASATTCGCYSEPRHARHCFTRARRGASTNRSATTWARRSPPSPTSPRLHRLPNKRNRQCYTRAVETTGCGESLKITISRWRMAFGVFPQPMQEHRLLEQMLLGKLRTLILSEGGSYLPKRRGGSTP